MSKSQTLGALRTVRVQVPFILKPHQALVRNALFSGLVRFFVMVCGRRSGKTLGAVYMTVEFLTTHPDTVGYWVAPTYGLTRKGMRETIRFLRHGWKHLVASVNRSEKRIEFTNGAFLEFHTADNPDSLVGEGLDWLVVDEAALIGDEEVWTGRLRPALADKQGRALFISSPRGKNWLYELFRRGEQKVEGWGCANIPTAKAGFVAESELLDIKRDTPERVWQQEYEARFLDDGGDVFRKVDAAAAPNAKADGYVVLGVDLAKTRDWTVIWALNELGEWVAFDRFQDLDWAVQKPRIVSAYRALGAHRALLDTTGMHVGGDAVLDDLRRDGLIVEGVNLDGSTKRAVIENAMLRFDQGAVTVPNDATVLDEFKRYTYTALPSGRDRYSAPSGQHDDIVMACALALWGIRQFTGRSVGDRQSETEIERLMREEREEALTGDGTAAWYD